MFQSTRPARGATSRPRLAHCQHHVSIHAPRAGRDDAAVSMPSSSRRCFNPRARAGRDARAGMRRRDATCFNPRARAGRDVRRTCRWSRSSRVFQSTRPRGARRPHARPPGSRTRFQSTRPARGATDAMVCSMPMRVSIHAPRAGRDHASASQTPGTGFNPRARAGRDVTSTVADDDAGQFQSTRPARGATVPADSGPRATCFNPRARAGRDWSPSTPFTHRACFNPRAPRGARRRRLVRCDPIRLCFNPRAPRGARRTSNGV